MKDINIRNMGKKDVDFVLSLGNKTPELWVDDETKFWFKKEGLTKWIEKDSDELFVFEKNNEKWGLL